MSGVEYIPFLEWLPDKQDTNNRGLEIAKNCLPSEDGFRGYPSFVRESTNSMDETAVGLFSSEDGDGTAFIFTGDASKLYRYDSSNTFQDVSKAGGYTNVTFWDFTQFEAQVIATGFNDPVQVFEIGSSLQFADLSASAPKARYAATVRDFVLLAFTNDTTDGTVPYRVWNSARADATDWVPSAQTQAGFREIYDSGPITGIIGGAFGTVFTTQGVHRFTYVGSPRVWQVDEIGNGVGCAVPGSIVKRIERRGELAYTYFKSSDSFMVTDGSTVRDIGAERVNQWFADNFDAAKADQMTAGVFGVKDSIIWSFPTTSATKSIPGLNDGYIAFSFSANKWSYGEIDVTQLGLTQSPAIFLDDITELVDDVTTLVDSSIWDGGDNIFGGVDHEGFFGTFVGPNLSPEFWTADYRYGPGKTRIGRIWSDIDGTVNTAVRYGDTPKAMGTFSANSSLRRGFTTHRSGRQKGNLFSIRVTSDSSFTEGRGINIEYYKGNT